MKLANDYQIILKILSARDFSEGTLSCSLFLAAQTCSSFKSNFKVSGFLPLNFQSDVFISPVYKVVGLTALKSFAFNF